MPAKCPDCDSAMLPADDIECEKARWVCPDCSPDFVEANATSYTNTDDPLPSGGDG